MTERWVGPGGLDANSGLTWALRKLTLNGVEDTPVVAGDIVHVGPGVYREQLIVDVSGGNTYAVGTVSVTNGSTTVTGAGTTFTGNVFAVAGYFRVRYAENGVDGVTNGDNSFTSAGADFDAGHAGMVIQINAKGAYKIASVTDANTLVLSDPNGLGWPADGGGGLTWSVMSGQGAYEIESVDDNTTLTLKEAWQGPTLDGLSYLTYQAIQYIADVTGEVTDGVGGIVRITGSDNDQTSARSNCVTADTFDYRVFRGFAVDMGSALGFDIDDYEDWVIEDCYLQALQRAILSDGADQKGLTLRRCLMIQNDLAGIRFYYTSPVDDTNHVVENCIILGNRDYGITVDEIGGATVRNCLVMGLRADGLRVVTSPTTGQTWVVNNSIFTSIGTTSVKAATLGDIIEDYNTFWQNAANHASVEVGTNTVLYPALFEPTILLDGFKFPWRFGTLSEWSPVAAIAGWGQYPAGDDLLGIVRPTTAAKKGWGPVQFHDAERSETQAEGGSASYCLNDAGDIALFVPVTAVSTVFTVQVYREANYAGTNPRLIIRQPGQADDVTTDAAAASQFNELTTTLTPDSGTDFVLMILRSLNTAAAGDYKVYFDTITVD